MSLPSGGQTQLKPGEKKKKKALQQVMSTDEWREKGWMDEI
jgi:hypothetical protein